MNVNTHLATAGKGKRVGCAACHTSKVHPSRSLEYAWVACTVALLSCSCSLHSPLLSYGASFTQPPQEAHAEYQLVSLEKI